MGVAEVRVGFDLSILRHSIGGVSRYVRGLCGALCKTASEAGIRLLTVDVPAAHPGAPPVPEAAIVLASPRYCGIPLVRRAAAAANLEERSRNKRLAAAAGCEVYHHCGVQPRAPSGARSVVTVYDTTALEHPEWHTEQTVSYSRAEAELLRDGAGALAISRWAADRAVEVLGVPPGRIEVAPGAADDLFTQGEPDADVLAGLGLADRGYLLHVGNFVPRKNIPMLIEAYRQARLAGLELDLVLVGQGGWKRPEVAGSGIRVFEDLPDNGLLTLYRGAAALLAPSECEGLGLPVLEAMACGCGVVASDAAALPETVGNGGILIPPWNAAAWRDSMIRLGRGGLAAELRAMAREAPRRTWRLAASAACELYRRMAG